MIQSIEVPRSSLRSVLHDPREIGESRAAKEDDLSRIIRLKGY